MLAVLWTGTPTTCLSHDSALAAYEVCDTVTGIQQGAKGDGCQEGNAIEVRNTLGAATSNVSVTGNTVSSYQKTGVLVKGQVSAVVTGNTISG